MKITSLTLAFVFCFSFVKSQTEYKDVAGIFYSRCTSCHHDGGAGPFPLTTYTETIQEGSSIINELNNGTMPPWSPDTSYTRFLHERIITLAEKNTIINWLNAGAPAGDTTLAPNPPVYSLYQLSGVPSMELQIPTFTSNATTQDSYICFSLPTNLTQDRYLRAFEVVPGNASIVHHVLMNVDTIGNTVNDLSGFCYTLPGNYGLGGFAPGAPPTVFPGQAPMKLGILIKAGSKIVLQMHYPAGSAGLVDSTKLRLYFYPVNETGIRPVSVVTPLQNWSLYLPPNIVSTFNATYPPLPYPVSLIATFPHSHLLCTQIVNYGYTSTDTIPLIRINDWDFEWQGYYNYRYPVKLPAGYTFYSQHVYDNTSSNPNNPNTPPQLVTAGLSTTDEMLFDSYQLTYYLPGDEFIDIANILSTDSLLSGIENVVPQISNSISAIAFPNPSSESINFRVESNDPNVSLEIISLCGEAITFLSLKANSFGSLVAEWDGTSSNGSKVSPGIYFYSVKNNSNSISGKIILLPSQK